MAFGLRPEWHLMAAHSKRVLNDKAHLPLSVFNERLPFVVIQRPTGALAILLHTKKQPSAEFFYGG